MDKKQEQLETLREIRSLMEQSSRFLSLSGLSGVIAGTAAIAGVAAAYFYLGLAPDEPGYHRYARGQDGQPDHGFYTFMLADIFIVLMVSLVGSFMLTKSKARLQGQPFWDATAKRLFVNMMIPLVTGGLYCIAMLYHGHIEFIAPATLLFYGLALVNASKYTLNSIRYLGVVEIITGLLASVFVEYGLLFWAFGFGIVHIVYGITMYIKYER
jgi:hypothetical protein